MTIKIIGIGDAGCTVVSRLHKSQNAKNYQTIALNTHHNWHNIEVDEQYVFDNSGLGANGNPMKGRQIAEQSKDFLFDLLTGSEYLIITAGMGGGTGTGAAHVIAYVARELRIPTVAIVSIPASFEGQQRQEIAKLGIKTLDKFVDDLIEIKGDTITSLLYEERHLALQQYYRMMDIFMTYDIVRQIEKFEHSGHVG